MKKSYYSRYIICLTFFLNATALHAQQTVTLTSDPWPPFILGEVGAEANGGTGVEVIRMIFSKIDDTNVSLPLLPWKRALNEVKIGKKDGIQLLRKTDERAEYMIFTESVFISRELLWYSEDKFPQGFSWNAISDLKNYTLGVVNGYSYSEEFDIAIENKELVAIKANDPEQIFTMLSGGRIDFAIANESVGLSLSKKYKNKIKSSSNPIAAEPHYIGISKKSDAKDLIEKINSAINSLKNEGIIDKIMFGQQHTP